MIITEAMDIVIVFFTSWNLDFSKNIITSLKKQAAFSFNYFA